MCEIGERARAISQPPEILTSPFTVYQPKIFHYLHRNECSWKIDDCLIEIDGVGLVITSPRLTYTNPISIVKAEVIEQKL